jgi:nucleoside-diphosphate-sugar epimerase
MSGSFKMRVLLAGATGAIGRPLIRGLKQRGHTVIGLVRSAERTRVLAEMDAEAVIGDALDAASVRAAIARVRPEAVINELTSLPPHYTPAEMKAAAERDGKVRREGNVNLLAAMREYAVRRYVLQASGFWYAPGPGLADESSPLAVEASPGVAASARTYVELESVAFGLSEIECVTMRYGFFYGPGTWYTKAGDMGQQVREQKVPIIGVGQGVYSFVHIEDAASATVAALDCAPGAYNIVDDHPSRQHEWLSMFARACGAPEPPRITEQKALATYGADSVYYATCLRGASNEKARSKLKFRPRPLEWLQA